MHPNNKMKTRSQSTQGTRPPRESNQPGVEKCNAESATSLEKHSDGNHAQGDLPAGPSRVTPTKKKPTGSHTENTPRVWRNRNRNVRMNLNGNKLASVWRDMDKKRVTDFEPRDIKEEGYRCCERYRFRKCRY